MEQRLTALEQQLSAIERRHASDLELLRERYDSQIADLRKTIMLQDKIIRHSLKQLTEAHATSEMPSAEHRATPEKPPKCPPVPTDATPLHATSGGSGNSSPRRTMRTAWSASRTRFGPATPTTARSPPRPAAAQPPVTPLPPSIKATLIKYQSRLSAIYDDYTHSSCGDAIFHPAMGLSHFTRLVRDCRVVTTKRPGPTAELLWMGILRALNARYPQPPVASAAANASRNSSHDEGKWTDVSATGGNAAPSPRHPSRSTLMIRGRYHATDRARDRFDFLRVQKIPRAHFGEALFLLWWQWSAGARSGSSASVTRTSIHGNSANRRGRSVPSGTVASVAAEQDDSTGVADDFGAFLSRRMLPCTAAAMERRRRHDASLRSSAYASLQTSRATWSGGSSNGGKEEEDGVADDSDGGRCSYNATITAGARGLSFLDESVPRDYGTVVENYSTSTAVKAIVKEFAKDVKHSYQAAVQGVGAGAINVDEFFALVRRYRLLPLITKIELKDIFRQCAVPPSTAASPFLEPPLSSFTLTLGGYLDALYCLADSIYGVPAVAQHYPTPDARLHKLFVKMFVLTEE